MRTIDEHPSSGRRMALGLAVAGLIGFGMVATAPVAGAATAAVGNGPFAFADREHGQLPVFACDPDNPNKQQALCVNLDGPRF